MSRWIARSHARQRFFTSAPRPAFGFGAAALDEILGAVERAVLGIELRQRVGLDRIDDLVRRAQRCLDRQRRARGDLARDRDRGVERGFARRRNLLGDAHAQGFLGGPVIAGQHVAHRVAPPGFGDEADRRAAARKTAVRVLVLAEARVGRGDADVAGEVELVAKIPRVAMGRDDDRLGPVRQRLAERIEHVRRGQRPPSGDDCRLRRVDVDAAGKIVAVSEQHRRAQRRIVLVLVERLREPDAGRRIEAILDERPVEADEHDVAAALDGDRRRRAERNVVKPRRGVGGGRHGRCLRLRADHHGGRRCGGAGEQSPAAEGCSLVHRISSLRSQ